MHRPATSPGGFRARHAAIIAAGLAFYGILFWYRGGNEARTSYQPEPGEIVRLGRRGSERDALLGDDYLIASKIARYVSNGDDVTFEEIRRSGRLFKASGRARVLRVGADLIEVRVLDGENSGRSGWTVPGFIQPLDK